MLNHESPKLETKNFKNLQRTLVSTIGRKVLYKFDTFGLRFIGVESWNSLLNWDQC